MFDFQPKRKIGSFSEELSSEPAAKDRPFVGSVSNSELIQLLSGSTPDSPDSPNTGSSQNTSGVPAGLKAKYEQLSGVSMDDVSVHYNSDKPIQYGALAYTQGNDVYLGPGQEQHLGHELGHVIQQKQGRVPVTGSVGGAPLNDDPALEHEADSLLSSNSPVQHITAGHHPDSGAPIQRLRINLSGDGAGGNPTIRELQYYNIPTGGDRVCVPNGEKKEVEKTVANYQTPLKINEDIVFEGHGIHSKGETAVRTLQHFHPKELAKMAASIPKPDDWKGRIILFGCSAGDIAPQVAKEYYNRTKESVIVVGPKENITSIHRFTDRTKRLFGFTDPEKETALELDPNFKFLRRMCVIIREMVWKPLKAFSYTLANPSITLQRKAIIALKVIQTSLVQAIDTINEKITAAPDSFWESYPNLKPNFRSLYEKFKLITQQLWTFAKSISSSPQPDDKMTTSQIDELHKMSKQITDLCEKICSECFLKCATVFKSFLDFNDKEMMISATYTSEDEDIELALDQRIALFEDHG